MLIRSLLTAFSPTGRSGKLSIFIFHRVLSEPDPLFPDEPCVERFDQIMGWIADWFNVLPLDASVEMLKRGKLPARAAAITFDDGYADNLLCAAPILKKHGLMATFFITTGFLDGGIMWNDVIIESIRSAKSSALDLSFLGLGVLPISTIEEKRQAIERVIRSIKHRRSAERDAAVERIRVACQGEIPAHLMLKTSQLIELKESGMGIGAHTVSHPILANLDEQEAIREIAESRDILEGLLKEKITLFAYPNGKLGADYTAEHATIVKRLGFQAAVTTNWGVCSARTDIHQLPRFTPWDTARWRFGFRLLQNLMEKGNRQTDIADVGLQANVRNT